MKINPESWRGILLLTGSDNEMQHYQMSSVTFNSS